CFSVRVRSLDKGLTWELVSKEPLPGPDDSGRPRKDLSTATARLPDGTLVYLQSRWIFTSASEAEELKKKNHVLEGAGPGQVAYMSRVKCYRSTDGGRTWDARQVTEIEPYYVLSGWGGATGTGWIVLDDGTLMGTMEGKSSPDQEIWMTYILSSGDGGKTWKATPVPYDPADPREYVECSIIRLAGGRVLLAARNAVKGLNIQVAWSDDNGRTWRPFCSTPMRGYPPHLLELKDGKVLCTYGRRFRPFGIRACLSSDGGETWDAENEIVIEDNGPETYLMSGGAGYPMSAQLSDGTIVTVYYDTKPAEIKGVYVAKGWRPDPGQDYTFCGVPYIGLARFTPDYVRPVGLEPGDATALPATKKKVAPDQAKIYAATDM
ncbi:MAG: hypothetical protein A3G75_14140, partial [Verrucomicrobia bacterium RIFCSPLOWO2_12_FULL_64_8]